MYSVQRTASGSRRYQKMSQAVIIGGGLAGSEAAFQLARRGHRVKLYEMRPEKMTPAHHTDRLAELVCSNSLRSNQLTNAVGLLKEEMRRLNSLIIEAADSTRVPAGRALAVDRQAFAAYITDKLNTLPEVEIIHQEVKTLPQERPLILATGPLTSDSLAEDLQRLTGRDYLYFYDAAAPIVTAESLNHDIIFRASRYEDEEDEGDYLNAPMTREEFLDFWEFLLQAEVSQPHDFEVEDQKYFEACLPIEVMARRGHKTLLFGPLKPVGLTDPGTGEEPHAVIQLRQDNHQATLYNMVGFQTRLKWGEQDRMLQYIPGMENAEIVRYGVMHRNTYINSPGLLTAGYQFRQYPGIFCAGQLTGVEGYVESASSGLLAGLNAAHYLEGEETGERSDRSETSERYESLKFPEETALGALAAYISDERKDKIDPMNINFGLIPRLSEKISDKRERNLARSRRALKVLEEFIQKNNYFFERAGQDH